MKKAFSKGTIPWTKAREAVKAATPETDKKWVKKCLEMTNRQIEKEVKQTLPPLKKKTLVLVLEGDMLNVWEQTREACERLAGKTLTDMEVFDLMCAEVLCTYATTPPFDPEKDDDGGFVRSIAERDGWRCTRPGCRARTALQGDHIKARSQGGSDKDWNKTTLCAACHHAKTTGILKVSGRAPDGLTWEGPFGVIEKPLPLPEPTNGAGGSLAREVRASYGGEKPLSNSGAVVSPGARSRDLCKENDKRSSDHVISEGATTRRQKKAPTVVPKPREGSKKVPPPPLLC
jgi:cytochrome c553